jgi:myosin heavy subunit
LAGGEGVEVGSDIEIKWAAHLLQLNVPGIVSALTLKTSEMRNENLVIPLNIDQALGKIILANSRPKFVDNKVLHFVQSWD